MEDRPDYFYMLNEQKKIDRVEKRQRNSAHKIVEEAMLATNICAGEFFAQHPKQGIFSSHIGFRPERLSDALSLITEDKPEYPVGDLSQLSDFQKLLRTLRLNLDNDSHNPALQSILQRMLQAGALSFEPQGHFGLGFAYYATVTSPIRRYQDFYNHLALKRILRQEPPLATDSQWLESLQEQVSTGRTACRQLELWLCCQYMTQHIGSVHPGTIVQVNAGGIGVRLDDIGVEGFVLLANKDAGIKPAFDARRLSLTLDDNTYRLDEPVYVMVTAVDVEKRRIALELVSQEIADRLSAWTTPETTQTSITTTTSTTPTANSA
jgi:exoribonuclease-2